MNPNASTVVTRSHAVESSIFSSEGVPLSLKDRTNCFLRPKEKIANAYTPTNNPHVGFNGDILVKEYARCTAKPHPAPLPPVTKAPIILRGGFGPLKEAFKLRQSLKSQNFRAFPPLCNAAYELNAQGRLSKVIQLAGKDTLDPTEEVIAVLYEGDISDAVPALVDADPRQLDGCYTETNHPSEDASSDPRTSKSSEPSADTIAYITSIPEKAMQHQDSESTLFSETTIPDPSSTQISEEHRISKGEILARNIDWRRPSFWGSEMPGISGRFFPVAEMRDEFVKLIDSGAEMLHCTICGIGHIPPGPPITIGGRDTCGSKLPEWFPSEEFANPWDSYIQLWNEIVFADEVAQGVIVAGNPSKLWDFQWHEPHMDWMAVRGRREGFWKCRSGPSAPEMEQNCNVCHVTRAVESSPADNSLAGRKDKQIEWIEKHINRVGLYGQAAAEYIPGYMGFDEEQPF